ncbi:hypothetical protein A2422_02370 [Candidatus Woesebacteria bacterium RIFOXYC1_FULL_31_51]|uniref:Methyltransferase domain-containing protein n=1 Tax=Candidatus Woesebacteria bacterium GW2011_GWC2_31_9 TaxID=1618586 RepID=A0A0G0AXN9_9BACT|nr:MAG: hypothetical protein UR17_C0001G0933 [Candidatus Woesebacteria bacterium GW2011_GWF1_31_35]KKP23524.1 MAG: hypothetical protein UR11_C0001G0498 [Candidatus Woesebacteria bacterium GW2011_GWC1_30_29]KKP25702.1 MAG: hypothetical protein UR13_C0007G0023 [Candidatus Woesebacteria bacterium GW2011_GWD1_31_12]KKP27800.1 MAG: hypothetical protein UR16_C0002G0130 [Candidatus Woesebacteria bacterium GW2011_GWB1_31_29]KKP31325.1 MAG: hypothetical protein UR21_C0011G0006 [Candidatus Woesebacteria 
MIYENEIFKFWNKHPNLRGLIKKSISVLAVVNIEFGKIIGKTYTLLFSVLGTSWYDHRYDYLRGVENFFWLERAFYTLDRINNNDSLLDIGCGDGLFDGVFYTNKAKKILAIDKDRNAIVHANKLYRKDNILFQKKDITRWKIPSNYFEIVTLYAVIEHFPPEVGIQVLKNIKNGLKKNGMLLGSTPIFNHDKKDISNWEHKNEFISEIELKKFLKEVFNNVKLKKTTWNKQRSDCYFECSN